MQPYEVDQRLQAYRQNKARAAYLDIETKRMSAALDAEQMTALANEALRAQQYSDMPHATEAGQPVEALVLKFEDGYTPPDIRAWRRELNALLDELRILRGQIACVDAWLMALPPKEQSVIRLQLLDGYTWSEIESMSTTVFGFHMTAGGLRKIKRRALATLYEVAR